MGWASKREMSFPKQEEKKKGRLIMLWVSLADRAKTEFSNQ